MFLWCNSKVTWILHAGIHACVFLGVCVYMWVCMHVWVVVKWACDQQYTYVHICIVVPYVARNKFALVVSHYGPLKIKIKHLQDTTIQYNALKSLHPANQCKKTFTSVFFYIVNEIHCIQSLTQYTVAFEFFQPVICMMVYCVSRWSNIVNTVRKFTALSRFLLCFKIDLRYPQFLVYSIYSTLVQNLSIIKQCIRMSCFVVITKTQVIPPEWKSQNCIYLCIKFVHTQTCLT